VPHHSISCRSGHDCCQKCCHDDGQRQPHMGTCRISAQRTGHNGRAWTMCLLLRIRCSVEQGRAHYMPYWVLDADPGGGCEGVSAGRGGGLR
jgi:hypothetical protein